MDKLDKKRRRSVRLLSQTDEIEKALIDNFEAKYGSVWKDFSPDYVSCRRKSITGRRSGIHKKLPLPVIKDDLETDELSVHNRFDSPELLRAPDNLSADNSLNGKVNTSAVTPNLMVPENDQSSSKTPEEILKLETPKSYAGKPVKDFSITPDNVEVSFETEFESPDYPEGILIGQDNDIDLCQSPIMSERYSQMGISVTPKYKKVDNEFRTPCAILKLNDSLPYSPSQPVFSTPSLNLPKSNSETPFSSHFSFDRVENSSVSSPSESEMTESYLDICSETSEKEETAYQTAPKQQLSSSKLSNKKVNKTENLETSAEKLEREKKETSTFLSICKSLASKIVNVVRKTPENDTDKQTENLENTIQDFFPAAEVTDTLEDKTHLDVNCETKLVFECEKEMEICVSDMPVNNTTITKKIEDKLFDLHSANHDLFLQVNNKSEKSNNDIINKCNKNVKLKTHGSLGKETTENEDAESIDTLDMISSHCHTESLSDNNNVKSFTLLKSVGSEEEKECHIKDLNLRDFNSNSKRRAVSEKVQVSNVQKHVHLLSNDAKSERGVVTDHQQITGQICSHETVQEGSKAPKKAAIKKQSKAKRLSMDSHILPDISSEKLSHDADAKDDKLKKKKSSTARRRSADPVLLARMSEKFGDKAGPSWTCAKKCADVEEVNEKKKDTNIPSLEEEIPKKKRGKPAKRNSDIGLSKLKKQDQDSIDKKDSIFKISSISDKSKIEDGENKDNVLKDDVPKKKKGRPARRKSADPILLSHISKDMVCNDDGICSQRCKNNEAINEIDSQNFDRNRANISNEIKINRRKGRTAGKKLKTSVKLSQIIEEAGDDKNDSGNSSHGSVNSGKDFESLINDNVTSHRINEVDKRGIETEQLTVSETEDLDKNITEREILLNHVNSADFDKIQEFLSMDEKKPIVKSSKSRRRSADALTLSDSVSHSQQDGNSDIPLRRTTRIKRRSIEIYQAGENYQNNDLESFSDSANSQEENNSLGTSESSSDVKAKPARKRKMKEENVEDIYRNKNYKRPDDRVWETIFECPDELKNPDQLLSKKRFKRSISFECIMPTKIKKRSKKAVDNGWDAKQRKKQQLPDEFVIEKLAELDSIFNS